ncbi:CDP-diacylglycerol--glycerol-3-phosphate 3-phosphatidyltransferase [Clostridiales bacterium]|nr:CDP-diacylglycerol--glycerol-3-phosphate 3-phosphatidyltransferase [Clostridiales bacterium]
MSMNLPNKLTIFRVILIPVFIVVLMGGIVPETMCRYIGVAIFCIASFTDYLDGHIARKYNLVTNFGKFMDPLADKLLVSSALICMIELGMLPAWIVIIIISREFIITGFRLLAAEAGLVIAASWWGKIKTVTQMAMIIVVILGVNDILGNILIVLATIFTAVSGIDYIVKNIKILKN